MLPGRRLIYELWSDDPTTHGPLARKAIIHDALRMGWSWYSRFPASAFFTLPQHSAHNALIVKGLDHLRVFFVDEAAGYGPVLVFAGRIGDGSESGDDVVWTAWSYLAELALSRTGYQVYYKSKQIKTVVTNEWERDAASGKFADYGARVRVHSLSNHVATGTIQNPRAEDGVSEMLTDPAFGVIDVPRLLLFFDLSEIGRANTNQNVTFEITREHAPTFNFWRNRGTALTTVALTYPGVIKDYRYVTGVLDIRNDLATIGTRKGKNVEMKADEASGTYGHATFGLRQDTFTVKTLSGYPKLASDPSKTSAQSAITKRAVKEATRPTRALQLDVRTDRFLPFDGWDMEDTIPVAIAEGQTQIARRYRIVGTRGTLDGRGYHSSVFVTVPVD